MKKIAYLNYIFLQLEHFYLQVVRNPFEFNVLGLFKYNKQRAFSVVVSCILHAVVLIQYDYRATYMGFSNGNETILF